MTTAESRANVFICHDSVHERLLNVVADQLRANDINVHRGDFKHGGPWESAQVIVPTIRSPLTQDHLYRAKLLLGVVFPTIGVESLDLSTANRLGIIVGHGATPENFICMAEATVMLALALMYRLHAAEDTLRHNAPKPLAPQSAMLRGKTAGLVGVGRIGTHVARLLASFGCTVIAHTRSRRPDPNVSRYLPLSELMAQSDIVFVLATLSSETRNIVGPVEFGLMKPTAYLVNTARGELVDERELCRMLRENLIAGAALDVFEREPLPAESELRSLSNVILTPHMIGHTIESTASLGPAAIVNVLAILRGELPPFCRNPEAANIWQRRRNQLLAQRIGPPFQ